MQVWACLAMSYNNFDYCNDLTQLDLRVSLYASMVSHWCGALESELLIC